ncbi:MAG: hypothetical protein ACYCW6_20810, partial [Candidatus Xenobia bacterium]
IGPVTVNHPVVTPQQPLVINTVGAPGASGMVQIGSVRVPLHEVTPGHFQATVTPPPGVNTTAPARVTLKLRNGQTAERTTAPVTLRGTAMAPAPPVAVRPANPPPQVVRPAPLPRPDNAPPPPRLTPQPLPQANQPPPHLAPRPAAPAAVAIHPVAPPRLTNVTFPPARLHPGQRVTIVASGTPHLFATAHIGSMVVPMREVRPGQYQAVFIAPNAKASSEAVTVDLRTPQGQSVSRRAVTPLIFGR